MKTSFARLFPGLLGLVGLAMAGAFGVAVITMPAPEQATPAGSPVPTLHINTNDQQAVTSRSDYVKARLSIEGHGYFDSVDDLKIKIRGRGNTSWETPKKPYKLNLRTKGGGARPLLGMASGKKWILLSNFIDHTLMTDVLSFKIARLLEMPYTHHTVAVHLVLNNAYQGVYLFTEHKEVAANRIDIGDTGILLELTDSKGRDVDPDPSSKMHYFFNSKHYQLPVLVRYPQLAKQPNRNAAQHQLDKIRTDFEELEACIAGDNYAQNGCPDLLDMTSLAQYMIVQQLTRNGEIQFPRSVYLYRQPGRPYAFGPVWDFDWAFGGRDEREHFMHNVDSPLLGGDKDGTQFFMRLMQSRAFTEAFAAEWQMFKENHYQTLVEDMSAYAQMLEDSGAYQADYDRWHAQQDAIKETPRERDMQGYKRAMLGWLEARSTYIDQLVASAGLQQD